MNTSEEETRAPVFVVIIAAMIVWYLILTPAIMLFWNVGLENSGIVENEITWVTAFALAVGVTMIGNVLTGRRR